MQDSQWDTAVLVCNPSSTTTVTLTFADAQGNTLYTDTQIIAGKGSRRFELSDLIEGMDYSNGSIKIDADRGIAAFALYYDLKL